MNIEELVRQHGYWMVAGGTLVEGDATVIAAAFLAHRGYLNLAWVCALAGLTTVLQNHALYELARRQGNSLAEGSGKTALRVQRVLGWVKTRGALLLFSSRFLIGVRSAAALACGIAQMPRARFFWTNLVGAALWTLVMAAAGYSGGHVFTLLVADVKRHELSVAGGLALAVTIGVLWKTRAADVVDQTIAAGMIEEWAKSRLLKRRKKDVPVILEMIRGLAEYEKLSHVCTATEEALRQTLFGARPGAQVVLAIEDGQCLGFALFFPNYSTFLAKPGMYLEDLFVKPDARGRGVGLALLKQLASIARERNYGRVEWSVLDWNAPAIGFYKKLGAVPMDEWTMFRLTGDAIGALADR